MSGLIWSALGQSIGNAATTVGNYMARDAELDERREDRRREREEDARRQAERDSLYRRPADQQSTGRSGSSGPRELTDDEQSAMAGMTRPEYDAYWGSVKTGDKSAFKREQQKITTTDTGDPYNPEMTSSTVTDYPPGFEAEYQAKVAKLAEIRKISVYNKDYDDVTRGERTKQEITRSDEAIANPDKAGGIGQGMAAGAGRGAFKVQGNTRINEFTGETESTDIGESIEARNRAAAKGKPAAKPIAVKDMPQERLTAEAETLRKAIDKASGDRKKSLETQFDDVMGELRRRRQSGAGASGAAPAPASAASGVTKGGSKWTQVN